MSHPRALLAALAGLAQGLGPGAVAAPPDTCGGAGRPFVELDLPDALPDVPADRLIRLLRGELAPKGIDVCEPPAAMGARPTTAAATARLTPGHGPEETVVMRVQDRLTNKALERRVPLREVRPDSRPLAVAIAIDELLRASWAELALPRTPEPVAREAAIGAPAAAPPLLHDPVSARFALERFGGGQTRLGPEVRLSAGLFRTVGLALDLGYRWVVPVSVTEGEIRAWAVTGGLGIVRRGTLPGGRAGVDLCGGLGAALVRFAGISDVPSVTGHSGAQVAVTAGGGPSLWLGLRKGFSLALDLQAGYVLRAARGGDGVATTGVDGWLVGAGLAVGGRR